ncbi:MAG: Uma2 family endonuclease [Candidatus Competibacteraceae bacterium]|nr:Uma2 family endonuclease [Candidatus Competibacteraceae bacterium]
MNEPQRQALSHLSHEDYFALEQAEDQRYEYLAGDIFAMTGGTERHALISMNVGASLFNAFRDKPCRVYGPDMKLHITAHDKFCYPDAMVLCQEGRRLERYVENPLLIVEVLSESTESYDRGLKFEHYRSIEGLQYFLLLSQDRPHAELYQRQGANLWTFQEVNGEEHLILEDGDIVLSLAELYRNVEFPPGD